MYILNINKILRPFFQCQWRHNRKYLSQGEPLEYRPIELELDEQNSSKRWLSSRDERDSSRESSGPVQAVECHRKSLLPCRDFRQLCPLSSYGVCASDLPPWCGGRPSLIHLQRAHLLHLQHLHHFHHFQHLWNWKLRDFNLLTCDLGARGIIPFWERTWAILSSVLLLALRLMYFCTSLFQGSTL